MLQHKTALSQKTITELLNVKTKNSGCPYQHNTFGQKQPLHQFHSYLPREDVPHFSKSPRTFINVSFQQDCRRPDCRKPPAALKFDEGKKMCSSLPLSSLHRSCQSSSRSLRSQAGSRGRGRVPQLNRVNTVVFSIF